MHTQVHRMAKPRQAADVASARQVDRERDGWSCGSVSETVGAVARVLAGARPPHSRLPRGVHAQLSASRFVAQPSMPSAAEFDPIRGLTPARSSPPGMTQ
jgi:hypothetical protein